MNIGVISDIHSDINALDTVLERLDKVHQVDMILCAGDIIGRGPSPDEVVTRIRERGIPTVKGNHDEWAANLSPENAAFLKQLPVDWQAEIDGQRIFMCHGKPGNNLWGMYRDHLSSTYVNLMLHDLGADIMITGHTHMPLYMRVEQGVLINPGSLYTFDSVRTTSHTYGVLHLPQTTFDLYDVLTETVEPLPLEELS